MFYFFLAPYIKPKESAYQHPAISLAEGFKELGISFASNINYWKNYGEEEYLFKQDIDSSKYDIHIYTVHYDAVTPDFLDHLDKSKFNVFIDVNDGIESQATRPEYNKFNLVLRSHFNKHIKYNSNVKPWAFGLSNRITEAIDELRDVPINNQLYNSLRFPHTLRKKAVDELGPHISKKYPIIEKITDPLSLENLEGNDKGTYYWKYSGRRHNLEYYQLLNSSLLSYSFGGYYEYLPFKKGKLSLIYSKVVDKICTKLSLDNSFLMYLVQYDSWRLWECLYSNSCPINMDFDFWDWELPVNPINGKHYLGVEKFKFKEMGEMICSLDEKEILKIGKQGKEWSQEHYSSLAISQRFIDLLQTLKA